MKVRSGWFLFGMEIFLMAVGISLAAAMGVLFFSQGESLPQDWPFFLAVILVILVLSFLWFFLDLKKYGSAVTINEAGIFASFFGKQWFSAAWVELEQVRVFKLKNPRATYSCIILKKAGSNVDLDRVTRSYTLPSIKKLGGTALSMVLSPKVLAEIQKHYANIENLETFDWR